MRIPFMGGAYEGRSTNLSPQTCINLFYEKGADGSESLVSTPGSSVFNEEYGGIVRGGIQYNDLAYFVIGDSLYEFNASGQSAYRGTLKTSSGRVSMAHNGVRASANQQIMIVDGPYGYIYDNTTQTLSEITDVDFAGGVTVVFADGYFIFNEPNSDRFWLTSLYDGTSIDSLDFTTAEGDPDEIQALLWDQRELHVFGTKTKETYYNSGDTDTPFQRFQGGFAQTGCAAPFSVARFDNSIIWLSSNDRGNGQVVRMGEGHQPIVVSTPEINYQISTYSTISDAFAYVYQDEGHEFYVLTFPTVDATWVFDASTQQWHQRSHIINGVRGRERYNCHVFAFGKHLVGDVSNGKIYELDTDIGTIDGTRIERERTSSSIANEEERLRLSSVQLDMEEGVGTEDVDDTSVYLSYSKNGGHTWSNEIERSFGDKGDYRRRAIWRKLGQARNWTFRVRTWSPNKVIIKGLIARQYGE